MIYKTIEAPALAVYYYLGYISIVCHTSINVLRTLQ